LRSSLDDLKDSVLEAALPQVERLGWSSRLLKEAGAEAGADDAALAALFPRGPIDLVVHYSDDCDAQMTERLAAQDLAVLKVRQRAILCVRTRIDVANRFKPAAKRAAAMLSFPLNAADAVACLARTSDAMWKAMGDTSADFNYYTKRLTLGAVYSTTLIYWFTDSSEDYADTHAFLERRIENIMQFEKVKARVKSAADKLPNPFKFFGRMRHPRS
jgi:ubiquinone biosynthesis protein COQ9